MSGARLCSLLVELGYEGADTLDPDSFEWPFQYDDARPILDWICSSLRPSNVLSLSELSQLLTYSLSHLFIIFFRIRSYALEDLPRGTIISVIAFNSVTVSNDIYVVD